MDIPLNSLLAQVQSTLAELDRMPRDVAEQTLRELITTLSGNPRTDSSDEACHTLGLLWYHLPEDSPERCDEAERWLRMALEINPQHEDARILLGHHFFDQNCYGAAREQFLQTPSGHFSRLGQKWRDLKVREMIACCEIYRYPDRLTPELVRPVCQDYLALVDDTAAQPLELVRAVAWATLSTAITEPIRRAARGCLEMIEWMQLGAAFADETRIIRKMTGITDSLVA